MKKMEKIQFENRAWKDAQYPRLHLKKPFPYFQHDGVYIHLSIGYHHGQAQRYRSDRWYLTIEKKYNSQHIGKTKIFSSIKNITDYIEKKYHKIAVIPKQWEGR